MKLGRVAVFALSAAVGAAAFATPASANTTASVNSPALPLKVRTGPARTFPQVGQLPHGSAVQIVCQVEGQSVAGTERQTRMWDKLTDGTYIFDGYVRRSTTPQKCATAGARAQEKSGIRWTSPLPGFSAQGGFRTRARPTHRGVDMMSFRGTPIRAAAQGTVVEVVCNIQPGGSCDRNGSPSSRGCGWYVKIAHPGKVATLYCHMLRHPSVRVGQNVQAGQVIGLVGSSGRSSFPHLHFEVHVHAPPTNDATAVDPMTFMASVGAPLPRGK